VSPGQRALLVGQAEDLEAADAALRDTGAAVVVHVATGELRAVLGRRRVEGAVVVRADGTRRVAVDLVVVGDRTPNLDLVLGAGARVESRDGVLVPLLDRDGRTTVPSLTVVGSSTGTASRVPPLAVHPRALVCFCEDVHVDEIRAQVGAGYGDPELVKRRTGALTGPCQGKQCLQSFAWLVPGAGDGPVDLPTGRPPLRPTRLGDLVEAPAAAAVDPVDPEEPEA